MFPFTIKVRLSDKDPLKIHKFAARKCIYLFYVHDVWPLIAVINCCPDY